MSALPGIRAWLPPVYGPKRRYEAPTCMRDRSKVWADTITVFQARHMLATMIDPKHIVSGWMPRRVRVTDDDGNVVREMTAEQLGVKLVARGAVEFAVNGRAIPSTVCPGCGGKKLCGSKVCGNCRRLSPSARMCQCGGRKHPGSSVCIACAGLAPKPEIRICQTCGGPKSPDAATCIRCSPSKPNPSARRCQCGNAKSHTAEWCFQCKYVPCATIGCDRRMRRGQEACVRCKKWKETGFACFAPRQAAQTQRTCDALAVQ